MTTPPQLPVLPPGMVQVFGLVMPEAMQARIITAVRGLWPQLTANLSDEAAIQAVLKHLATDWVANWESRQAGPDPALAAQQAADAAAEARAAADAQARADTQAGIVPTITV